MNLVIDVGNSQYKVCVFNDSQLEFHAQYEKLNSTVLLNLVNEYKLKRGIFSDTRGIEITELSKLLPSEFHLMELTHNTPIPIKINYLTPHTLGKDRIAGAVAANEVFYDYPILVVDVGTAITIDFISSKGVFEGGIISPGPELRYKSLHQFTGKLPLCKPVEEVASIGNSTETAIESGVQNGILYEINGYIARYIEQYPPLKIVLTGGYSYLFDKKIKYPIFADSFLIPKGLNRILKYNE
ncbi:MAG: type III pantothenate kinase [Salinivirgaceae bacterium]|jgi:type III pantothenate kinase